MPYAALPAPQLAWHITTRQQVLAGLCVLSTPPYMFGLALLPLFTTSTLLLDAAGTAPAIPNVVVGAFVTVVIAVVGWLLKRAIELSDAAQVETKEAVRALTLLVTEMRLERKDDRVLTTYLKERQDKLEHENKVLRESVTLVDRQLAIQIELRKHTPPNL